MDEASFHSSSILLCHISFLHTLSDNMELNDPVRLSHLPSGPLCLINL